MSLRASLRSVSCWRASGKFDAAQTTQSGDKRFRFLIKQNNHQRNNVAHCGVIAKKMFSTFEEHVFGTVRCASTLATKKTTKQHNGSNGTSSEIKVITKGKSDEEIQSDYEEAIRTLNRLQSNADTIRRAIAGNVKQTTLKDMPKFLERSGITLDELDKQSFIHVSGTKGKGSTCALTESILRSFGVKTGFFSSPHLVSVTERIRINGEPIEKEKFTNAFWRVYKRLEAGREHAGDMPAYFRFLTLLCFHIFIEAQVDVIILEVGIGGELDCTNVLRNTKTVGITSLGLEHTQLLGDTLAEIAWQKAGIIKPGSHVYTSVHQAECLNVIKQRAAEKNATLHVVPDFADYCQDPNFSALLRNLNNVTRLNGSLAIQLAYDWLNQHKNGFKRNFAINETKLSTAVVNGLINCNWPGRCQEVKFMNFSVHLDGAHTVESMHICSDWFAKVTAGSTAPKILIFNTTGDRDSKKLLDVVRHYSAFDVVCFVPNIVSNSGGSRNDVMSSIGFAEQLKRAQMHAGNWNLLCDESGEKDNGHVFETILDSFNYLYKLYGSERQLDVLITGSLHLIGATILALNEYKKRFDDVA